MARPPGREPERSGRPERDWAFEFKEAAYLSLGMTATTERPRLLGRRLLLGA